MTFIAAVAWLVLAYAGYRAYRAGWEAWLESFAPGAGSPSGVRRPPPLSSLRAGAGFPGMTEIRPPAPRDPCPGPPTVVGEAHDRRSGT